MRKLLTVFGLLFLAAACTNNDEIYDPTEPFTMMGSWKMASMEVQTPIDLNGDGIAGTDLMEETGCYQNERLLFGLDNTGTIISNSYLEIIVNIDFPENAEVEFECENDSDISGFEYHMDNGMVSIITDEGDEMVGNLTEDKHLVFTIPNGQVYFDEDFEIVMTENLTVTYIKED